MSSFKEVIKLEGINTIEIKQSIIGLKKELDDPEEFLDFLTEVIDSKNQKIAGLQNSIDHVSGKKKYPASLDG